MTDEKTRHFGKFKNNPSDICDLIAERSHFIVIHLV